jgi:hypothetical protein
MWTTTLQTKCCMLALWAGGAVAAQTDVNPYALVRPDSLIAFYPLDGDTKDYAPTTSKYGYKNDAIGHGLKKAYTAKEGGAYFLDGSGYIDVPVNINPMVLEECTVGAWVKADSYTPRETRYILSQDDGGFDRTLAIDFRGNGTTGWSAFAGAEGTGVVGSVPVALERWTFVAAVYTATTVSVFVDGTQISGGAKMGRGAGSLRIGANGGVAGSLGFRGTVDNVFVYSVALSRHELEYLRTIDIAKPLPAAGTAGYALNLLAENSSYVAVPDQPWLSGLSALSIFVWVQPRATRDFLGSPLRDAPNVEYAVVDKSGEGTDKEYRLSLVHDKGGFTHVRLRLGAAKGGVGNMWDSVWNAPNSTLPTDGTWSHLGVVWDGKTVVLYVNGVAHAQRAVETDAQPQCEDYVYALPQEQHPGVPQAQAEASCLTGAWGCSQPDYTCNMVVAAFPTLCGCRDTPIPRWRSASHHGHVYAGLLADGAAPLLVGAANVDEPDTRRDGKLGDFFNGGIDELQVWSVARSAADAAVYFRSLRGDEAGLAGYWPFDEGVGTVATSRAPHGGSLVDSRGVLHPPLQAVGAGAFGHAAAGLPVPLQQRFWQASNAHIEDRLYTVEDADVAVVFNGTDATRRQLYVTLTQLPASGSLFLAVQGAGAQLGRLVRGAELTAVPARLALGASALYAPRPQSHGAAATWSATAANGDLRTGTNTSELDRPDDSDASGLAADTFAYVVSHDDSVTRSTAATFTSNNTCVVSVYVSPRADLPILSMGKPVMTFEGFRVEDVDAWEYGNRVGVRLAVQRVHATAVPGQGFVAGSGGANASDAASLDSRFPALTLGDGATWGDTVDFRGVSGRGDGSLDQVVAWDSTVDDANMAIESITLLGDAGTRNTAAHRVTVDVEDYGNSVEMETPGPSLKGSATMDTAFRLGSVPRLTHLFPQAAPVEGGSYVELDGEDFGGEEMPLHCVFGVPPAADDALANRSAAAGAAALEGVSHGAVWHQWGSVVTRPAQRVASPLNTGSEGRVLCEIPPSPLTTGGGAGLLALALSTDVNFTSNAVGFRYRPAARVSSLQPDTGPVGGGTPVIVTGSGFVRAAAAARQLLCRFGGSGAGAGSGVGIDLGYGFVVPASFISPTKLRCVAPAAPGRAAAPAPVEVSANGGRHWTSDGVSFAFAPRVLVSWLQPAGGPAEGGKRSVRVFGLHFRNDTDGLACRFGQPPSLAEASLAALHPELPSASSRFETAAATFVSETEVRCDAPAQSSLTGAEPAVSVTVNGVDYATGHAPVVYKYTAAPRVHALFPKSGALGRGTGVTVSGAFFADTPRLQCRFVSAASAGNATPTALVPAVFVSPSEVVCAAPLAGFEAGEASVEVTLNSEQWTADGLRFRFTPPASASSAAPRTGPIAGGTLVTVAGGGFRDTEALSCRFGPAPPGMPAAVVVRATWLGPAALQCVAPPLPAAAAGASVAVPLTVTDNGADHLALPGGAAAFVFELTPVVTAVTVAGGAATGPTTGGTAVTVRGAGFSSALSPPALLRCRFDFGRAHGFGYSRATLLSDSALACPAPRLPTAVEASGSADGALAHVAQVSVTVNGQQWSEPSGAVVGAAAAAGGASTGFAYEAAAHVRQLSPVSGPSTGGTRVTVSGHGFALRASLSCGFRPAGAPASVAATEAKATYVSSTTLTCVAPAMPANATVGAAGAWHTVEVSNNGADYSVSGVGFKFAAPAEVTGVSPASGPVGGGTVLTLTGVGFGSDASSSTFYCAVGSKLSPATLLSSTAATCVAPAAAGVDTVAVSVSLNGQNLAASAAGATFSYTHPTAVHALTPSRGSALGGTAVVVAGSGFGAACGKLSCRFGASGATATATLLNGTHVVCIAPALPAAEAARAAAEASTAASPAAKVEAAIVAATSAVATAAVSASVVVSCNGRDFGSSAAAFTYLALAHVTSVSPNVGAARGGTAVGVSGVGFEATAALRCRFGTAGPGAVVAAEFVSDTLVRCVAPASAAGNASSASVSVEVTSNGQDYTDSQQRFYYRPGAVVTSVSPSVGPARGGTLLTVNGLRIEAMVQALAVDGNAAAAAVAGAPKPKASLFCLFSAPAAAAAAAGAVAVPPVKVAATWLTAEAVQCVAPPRAVGKCDVALSENGVDASEGAGSFTYVAETVISAVEPSAGPAGGGTAVTVTGTGFIASPRFRCRFGAVSVLPVSVSPKTAVCVAPAHAPAAVAVGVTNNNADYADADAVAAAAATFTYRRTATTATITPKNGPVGGGTVVAVTGANFDAASDDPAATSGKMYCRFGSSAGGGPAVVVEGQWSTPFAAACTAPPMPAGITAVEVSAGGADFTGSGVQFEYQPDASVTAVSPASGPEEGATQVVVTGTGFARNTPALLCRFGAEEQHTVPATWLSATAVACAAPLHAPGTVAVTVTLNGQQFSAGGAAFTFGPAAAVSAALPAVGSVRGGTPVRVHGDSFTNGSALACRFGDASDNVGLAGAATGAGALPGAVVPATWISAGELECVAPPRSAAGLVVLRVTNNGQQFSSFSTSFAYSAHASVAGLSPRTGPAAGGTSLTLTGSFGDEGSEVPAASCRFRDASASGAAAAGGAVLLEAAALSTTASAVVCTAPPHAAGAVLVDASTNNVDWSEASGYTYMPDAWVSSVKPAAGPETGGTVVSLLGWGFLNTGSLRCRFGTAAPVPATWVAGGVVQCAAPPVTGQPGVVRVEVSNNALDFTGSGAEFRYHDAAAVTHTLPAAGSELGGTVVTVFGDGFVPSVDFRCRFGIRVVVPRSVTPTQAICVAPAAVAARTADGGGSGGEHAAAASVLVAVANNGVDFVGGEAGEGLAAAAGNSSDGVRFAYLAAAEVRTLGPKAGPVSGGTAVTVTGSNFVRDATSCRFGPYAGAVVAASFVSSGVVVCVSPTAQAPADMVAAAGGPAAAAAALLAAQTAPAAVEVSVNGVDFSASGVQFEYQPDASVTAVSPASGPEEGATQVVVTGTGFARSRTHTYGCVFGALRYAVPATWLSATAVACAAPPQQPGTVTVNVTLNGQQYTGSGAAFEFQQAAVVTAVSPSHGPLHGGTTVTVHGVAFADSGGLRCRFGTVAVPAAFVSSLELSCVAPAQAAAGVQAVAVSNNNGSDWTQAAFALGGSSLADLGAVFAYNEPAVVTAVAPVAGPAAGGTVVRVTATNVRATDRAWCRFQRPAGAGAAPVDLPAARVADGAVLCEAPPHAAGTVGIEVSTNGKDFTACGWHFTFMEDLQVLQVAPGSGPVGGGVPVTVTGANFERSDGLRCRFGLGEAAPARYISNTQVLCTTPAVAAPGVVAVAVTNNEADFVSSASASYRYRPDPVVERLLPAAGPVGGGTRVLLRGTHFHDAAGARCQFGGVEAEAAFVNDTHVECFAPAQSLSAAGAVPVTLHLGTGLPAALPPNGEAHLSFTYAAQPAVTSLSPAIGHRHGGTQVDLLGSGFGTDGGLLACRFGKGASAVVVPAAFLSATHIRCVAPAAARIIPGELLPVETVAVEVTADGVHYTGQGTQFSYFVGATVESLLPSSGSEGGGTQVTVRGANFLPLAELCCRFGGGGGAAGETVKATWLAPDAVRCTAPKSAVGGGSVEVQVSNNGKDFSEARLSFAYRAPAGVSGVEPASGSEYGGTSVRVSGTSFDASAAADAVLCKFGDVIVTASAVTATGATCVVPALVGGAAAAGGTAVSVSVSMNGQDFSEDEGPGAGTFTYTPRSGVGAIMPLTGAPGGGTQVVVTGVELAPGATHVTCRFGASAPPSDAVVLNSSAVRCLSPAVELEGAQLSVGVEVSSNGVDFTESGVQFTYQRAPALRSLSPAAGSESGGSEVHIFGQDFLYSAQLRVRFGQAPPVVPVWVSSRMLVATSPPGTPGPVELQVTLNGVEYSPVGLQWTYSPAASVASLSPADGPLSGNTRVTVKGANFVESAFLFCRVGEVLTVASFVSASELSCLTPPRAAAGALALGVTTDGSTFDADRREFQYLPPPAVLGLSPPHGGVGGGTVVVVRGAGFRSTGAGLLQCVFGGAAGSFAGGAGRALAHSAAGASALSALGQSVPAKFVSDTEVHCVAPPHAIGSVAVEVTCNGADFSSSGVAFAFEAPPVVFGASPATALFTGGAAVTVNGRGFRARPASPAAGGKSYPRCRFGLGPDSEVAAKFVSGTVVECIAPPHLPGNTTLEVTNNGVDYSADGEPFRFHEPATVVSLAPGSGSSRGGSIVTVTGTNFIAGPLLACRFGAGPAGSVHVPAYWLSATAVACAAPPSLQAGVRPLPGRAELESTAAVALFVTNNRQEYNAEAVSGFSYHPQPAITAVAPRSGPVGSAVAITLTGSNLGNATNRDARCRLGGAAPGAASAVRVVDASTVVCMLTPAAAAQNVPVELSVNGRDFDAADGRDAGAAAGAGNAPSRAPTVELYLPSAAASAEPAGGPEAGGTAVVVTGSGFLDRPTLQCRFGSAPAAAAVWLSPTQVRCVSPASFAGGPGAVPLAVSNNAVHFGEGDAAAASFEYRAPEVVTGQPEPPSGDSSGGTTVTVRGTGFVDGPALSCRFAAAPDADGDWDAFVRVVPAAFVSEHELTCVTPAQPAGAVAVSVANNGADFGAATEASFTFLPTASVSSVTPRVGIVGGGTVVAVSGAGFVERGGDALVCKFGAAVVLATFYSSSLVTCTAPAAAAAGGAAVALEVSNVGAAGRFSSNGQVFEFRSPITVASASPAAGPDSGGTAVEVRGTNFLRTDALRCRFGELEVAATFVADGLLRCTAPAQPAGRVELQVLSTAQGLTAGSFAEFTYAPAVLLLAVSPSKGPVTGGTAVALTGVNFVNSSDAVCRFGAAGADREMNARTVAAAYVSPTEMRCLTPPGVEGAVSVELSCTGVDFTAASGASFRYHRLLTISRLTVAAGSDARNAPVGGGTVVTVTGTNFEDSGELTCRFGGARPVFARFVDTHTATCVAPPAAAGAGDVEVALSSNGVDLSGSGQPFTYLAPVAVSSVSPARLPQGGGTRVTVRGADFPPLESLACRFGDLPPVRATWLAADRLECTAPAHAPAANQVPVFVTANDGADYGASSAAVTFAEMLAVVSVSPASGALTGRTALAVGGSGFSNTTSLRCRFSPPAGGADAAAVEVPATFLSPTQLTCTTPAAPGLGAGDAALTVTANGADWSADAVAFSYLKPASVTALHPRVGPLGGGTLVLVRGKGFARADSLGALRCRFGADAQPVPAVWVDESAVECAAPAAAAAGAVAVLVTSNGADYTAAGTRYEYFAAPVPEAASPATVPQTGGTVVEVRGSGFADLPGLACRFGRTVAPAVWVSDAVVRCTAPAHTPGFVLVDLSLNGQDFSSSGLALEYQLQTAVYSLAPARGTQAGGTAVLLRGDNFAAGEGLRVRLTSAAVDGRGVPNVTYVTPQFVSVTTLQLAEMPAVARAGAVSIEVSTNGVDYTSDGRTFLYEAAARVAAALPKSGGLDGGTRVVVRGRGFVRSAEFACRFGAEVVVPAEWLNATAAVCFAPAVAAAAAAAASEGGVAGGASVSLEVSNANGEFSADGVQFVYRPDPVVQALNPNVLPETAAVPIAVSGAGFDNTEALACKFADDAPVPATWVSEKLVTCVARSRAPGSVTVSVTNNGVDFVRCPTPLVYEGARLASALSPAVGPTRGGTRVVVQGLGFVLGSNATQASRGAAGAAGELTLYCRFGPAQTALEAEAAAAPTDVQASVLSATAVACEVPEVKESAVGAVSVEVILRMQYDREVAVRYDGPPLLFTYQPMPAVSGLVPKEASSRGGTRMAVAGSGFAPIGGAAGLRVRLGAGAAAVLLEPAAVRWVSSTELALVVPANPLGPSGKGLHTVEVSNNGGADWSDSGVLMLFAEAVFVSAVQPQFLPEAGGTVLTLTGGNFQQPVPGTDPAPASRLVCKFGNLPPVPATWLSADRVTCASPPSTPTTVVLEVSNDGETFSSDGVTVTYRAALAVLAMLPAAGPARGGTVLTLTGTGFRDTDGLACAFGADSDGLPVTDATVLSASELTCPTPPLLPAAVTYGKWPHAVNVSLVVRHNRSAASSPSARGLAGSATDVAAGFSYHEDAQVAAVSPKLLPARGGTLVHVRGAGFSAPAEADHLACRFGGPGGAVVRASFASPTVLTCSAPPALGALGGAGGGAGVPGGGAALGLASIELTLNGLDYTQSGLEVTYIGDESISAAVPSRGPEHGGTEVTVHGAGFVDSELLHCRFGTLPLVPAQFVTAEAVRCTTPLLTQQTPMGEVAVHVTNNKADFSPGPPVRFTFQSAATVYALHPPTGPSGGGSRVLVTGANFVNSSGLYCRFGEIVMLATFVNSSALRCTAPRWGAGPVAVEVTNYAPHTGAGEAAATSGFNPEDLDLYTDDGVLFMYQEALGVTRVTPLSGPVEGGTVVLVDGSAFANASGALLLCRFGDATAPAVLVSSSRVRCVSPPAAAGQTGTVGVDVAVNGVDFTDAAVQFTYQGMPQLLSVRPERGQAQGGTRVTVTGTGFDDSLGKLSCRFGGTVVPARAVSGTRAECVTPPAQPATEVQRIRVLAKKQAQEIQQVTSYALPAADEVQLVRSEGWGWADSVQAVTARVAYASAAGVASPEVQVLRQTVAHEAPLQTITTTNALAHNGTAANCELQTVTTVAPSGALGGSFKLRFDGIWTAAIPHGATGAQVAAALEAAVPALHQVSVTVAANTLGGRTFAVAFERVGTEFLLERAAVLGTLRLPLLEADGELLTAAADTKSFPAAGAGNAVAAAAGADGASIRVARARAGAGALVGGTFSVQYNGTGTASAVDADEADFDLGTKLSTIADGRPLLVTRADGSNGGYVWSVSFTDGKGGALPFTIDGAALTGAAPAAAAVQTQPGTSDDVQTLSLLCVTGGNSFYLAVADGDEETADMVTPANVAEAGGTTLDALRDEISDQLPSMGPATVTYVSATPCDGAANTYLYEITFGNPTVLPPPGLHAGAGTGTWTGDAGLAVARASSATRSAAAGTMTVAVGAASVSVPLNASADEMGAALGSLTTVGDVTVTRTTAGSSALGEFEWTVTYAGQAGNVPELQVSSVAYAAGAGGLAAFRGALTHAVSTTQINTNADVALGGDFQLVFTRGTVAAPGAPANTLNIPYDASAATVAARLSALPGAGAVQVTASASDPNGGRTWTVTFSGEDGAARGAVPALTAVSTGLTASGGAAAEVVVAEDTGGALAQVQLLSATAPSAVRGVFRVTHRGKTSPEIAWNASAAEVEAALEGPCGLDAVLVTRHRASDPVYEGLHGKQEQGFAWAVTFLAEAGPQPLMTCNATWLVGEGTPPVCASTELQAATSAVLGGSFRLAFEGQSTAAMDYDADATVVQARLRALSGLGRVDVSRSAADTNGGYVWSVTFKADGGFSVRHVGDMPALEAIAAGTLTGTGAAVTVEEETRGSALGGTFTLSLGGPAVGTGRADDATRSDDVGSVANRFTSAPLAFDASAGQVRAAVEGLLRENLGLAPVVGTGALPRVDVSRGAVNEAGGFTWTVGFESALLQREHALDRPADLELLVSDASQLSGSQAGVVVLQQQQGTEPVRGTFRVSFQGETTRRVEYNATADELRARLLALPTVGAVQVSRHAYDGLDSAGEWPADDGMRGLEWRVTFTTYGSPANLGDLPAMEVDDALLYGSWAEGSVDELRAGCCALEVSANGQQYTAGSGVPFRFDPEPAVEVATPAFGAVSGGTVVTLLGSGFAADTTGSGVRCLFGGAESGSVPGVVLNETAVRCTAPPAAAAGRVLVAVKQIHV